MGYNTGIQENILTIFFLLGTIVLSIISFVGAGDFVGFLNEAQDQEGFSFGIFDFVANYAMKRFLHLSIIPTAIGLLLGSLERIPKAGNRVKMRTFKPLNLSALTFFNYFLQITPAILGWRVIQFNPYELTDEPISATWLSDAIMVPYGYALLSLAFLVSMATGFYYITAYWVHNEGQDQVFKEFFISAMIVVMAIISFTGFGAFEGFLAEYEATSFDDYMIKYGLIHFFYEGPMKSFSHLIVIPALVGLFWLVLDQRPKIMGWISKRQAKGRAKRGLAAKAKKPKKLGAFALTVILLQLLPAIIGLDISPTWLSDLIMDDLYGYFLMTAFTVFGMAYGMYRAVTGSLLHQR